MKIIHQGENSLILKPAEALIPTLFGIVFAIAGLLSIVFLRSGNKLWYGAFFLIVGAMLVGYGIQARSTTWTFDRARGNLVHRRRTISGVKSNEYALRDITAAQLGARADYRRVIFYGVELLTRSGATISITITPSNFDKSSKERAVTVINEFLQC